MVLPSSAVERSTPSVARHSAGRASDATNQNAVENFPIKVLLCIRCQDKGRCGGLCRPPCLRVSLALHASRQGRRITAAGRSRKHRWTKFPRGLRRLGRRTYSIPFRNCLESAGSAPPAVAIDRGRHYNISRCYLQPIGDHGLRGFKPGCLTPLDGIRGSEMSGDFRLPSLPRRVTEGGNISAPVSQRRSGQNRPGGAHRNAAISIHSGNAVDRRKEIGLGPLARLVAKPARGPCRGRAPRHG